MATVHDKIVNIIFTSLELKQSVVDKVVEEWLAKGVRSLEPEQLL